MTKIDPAIQKSDVKSELKITVTFGAPKLAFSDFSWLRQSIIILFASTMNVLSEALKSTNELVTALIVQKSEELEQLDASWLANDELAKTMIKDLQTQCQILSHSAVKLALLVNTSDPGSASLSANIEELCAEIKPQVDTFVAIFV